MRPFMYRHTQMVVAYNETSKPVTPSSCNMCFQDSSVLWRQGYMTTSFYVYTCLRPHLRPHTNALDTHAECWRAVMFLVCVEYPERVAVCWWRKSSLVEEGYHLWCVFVLSVLSHSHSTWRPFQCCAYELRFGLSIQQMRPQKAEGKPTYIRT